MDDDLTLNIFTPTSYAVRDTPMPAEAKDDQKQPKKE